jgi:wyosine [tRNA(Phe)-imidazoG37] synthetase (radical SAM superfamily)
VENNLIYIYGPVSSWRLGKSLGVDVISSDKKICNFDCVYCQLGQRRNPEVKERIFVPTKCIMEEFNNLKGMEFDYITFSGMGEPTLARNLYEIIAKIKKTRKEKIAVLTNASLLSSKAVVSGLLKADIVVVKLDAITTSVFNKINRPQDKKINSSSIMKDIEEFSKVYKGKLDLQIMFIRENIKEASLLADFARKIGFYEVQINTPLRPSASQPLSKQEILKIKKYFSGVNVVCVYDKKNKSVTPLNKKNTIKRHPKV